MKASKDLIEEVVEEKKKVSISFRSIACELETFSEFVPFNSNYQKLIYNSKLIDGVKIKMSSFVLKLNKRHNFK